MFSLEHTIYPASFRTLKKFWSTILNVMCSGYLFSLIKIYMENLSLLIVYNIREIYYIRRRTLKMSNKFLGLVPVHNKDQYVTLNLTAAAVGLTAATIAAQIGRAHV